MPARARPRPPAAMRLARWLVRPAPPTGRPTASKGDTRHPLLLLPGREPRAPTRWRAGRTLATVVESSRTRSVVSLHEAASFWARTVTVRSRRRAGYAGRRAPQWAAALRGGAGRVPLSPRARAPRRPAQAGLNRPHPATPVANGAAGRSWACVLQIIEYIDKYITDAGRGAPPGLTCRTPQRLHLDTTAHGRDDRGHRP
jgi:hypothetical protein